MSHSLWITTRIHPYQFHLLNLDHPQIETTILHEIDAGIDVYYDRRWEITEVFCRFLIEHRELINNLTVLVLGAGIGMESLVIGRLCKKMYLNDLAPIALELCSLQLRKNDITNFELFPGRYETLNFPSVDIIIGCFLVYNAETVKSMKQFLNISSHPTLLMNEPLPPFKKFIQTTHAKTYRFLLKSPFPCVLFE
jgi:predicted nicotinamide N-methyase